MVSIIKKGLYRILHKIEGLAIKRITRVKPELITGPGTIKELYKLLISEGIKKPLVVTDKGLTDIQIHAPMFKTFKENDINYVVFDDVMPNPTIGMVETVRDVFLENKCDCMIGFGGGSPIDCAKIALGLVGNPGKAVRDLGLMFKVEEEVPPFYAVPTTAGTGTETNFGGVITDPESHEKFALGSNAVMPKYAILDPELTLGLPPFITGTTGMDALTHAVEAYLNITCDKKAAENVHKAVKIIFKNLLSLYQNGNQLEEREQMLLGAHYAGLAMVRAMLGYVHAIAHKLGGLYNLPHGLANAIVLPKILDYYGEKVYKKLAKLAIMAGIGNESESNKVLAEKFIQAIRDMNKKMGIPSIVKEIKMEDIDEIAQTALKEANPLYPVPKIMGLAEMKEIIMKLMPS